MFPVRPPVSVAFSLAAFVVLQVGTGTRADAQLRLAGRPVDDGPPGTQPRLAGTPVLAPATVQPSPAGTLAGRPAVAPAAGPIESGAAAAPRRGFDPSERTEVALRVLSSHVSSLSHPEALRQAFRAYHNYRAARPGVVRKPYLYFVDLGLNSQTPRGYVFDMDRLSLVEGPFAVAHGRGSSPDRPTMPTRFSNRPGSLASSLGIYLAQETYTFRGSAGGGAYRSVGLRLRGESGEFNNAARQRGIVAHGAPYVTARTAGRSEGCPAMEPRRAERLLPMLANGGVVLIYSPNDTRWLNQDPWMNAAP